MLLANERPREMDAKLLGKSVGCVVVEIDVGCWRVEKRRRFEDCDVSGWDV